MNEVSAAQSPVLTRVELEALTGYTQPKRMVTWLEGKNWVFEAPTKRADVPKVDRAYYFARMSGQVQAAQRQAPRLAFFGKR